MCVLFTVCIHQDCNNIISHELASIYVFIHNTVLTMTETLLLLLRLEALTLRFEILQAT